MGVLAEKQSGGTVITALTQTRSKSNSSATRITYLELFNNDLTCIRVPTRQNVHWNAWAPLKKNVIEPATTNHEGCKGANHYG